MCYDNLGHQTEPVWRRKRPWRSSIGDNITEMIVEHVDELVVRDIESLSTVYDLVSEFSSPMSLIGLNPGALYQVCRR